MKMRPSTAALFSTFLALSAYGQTPVSTGVVQAVGSDGTLTLRANQPLAAPLVFHGMGKAKIETVDGKVATLANLTPGLNVTVHYAQQENRWYVSRVVIPDPAAATATTGTTTGTAAGAVTARPGNPAADDDITTRPGQGAAGDRTVQPPQVNATNDGDITTEQRRTSTNVQQTAP